MASIFKLLNKLKKDIYPITVTKAVYLDDGKTNLHDKLQDINTNMSNNANDIGDLKTNIEDLNQDVLRIDDSIEGINANISTIDNNVEEINLNNAKYRPELGGLGYYNGTKWIKIITDSSGGGSGEGAIFEESVTVSGVTVGNLSSGTVIPAGTSVVDVLKQMLVKIIPPTYTQPTVNITSTVTAEEFGKSITPMINLVFTKNDAGNSTSSQIKEGSAILSTSFTYTLPSFNLTSDRTFTGIVNYAEGLIKNNNVGQADGTGHILAGSKSSTVSIKAYRPYFGFADTRGVAPDSTYIRGKSIAGLNINNGSTIQVATNPDSRMICFAYPATVRDCTKIRYENLNDDGNKSAFTSIILKISDASGNNSIDYRVYYYIAPIAFGNNATFTLTV